MMRPAAPKDPFFDRPYEAPAAAGSVPAWDVRAAKAGSTPQPLRTSNIRAKKKVAALLGGGAE
jgi:hypothetical protein